MPQPVENQGTRAGYERTQAQRISGNLYRGEGGEFQGGPGTILKKRLEAIRQARKKGKGKGGKGKAAKPKVDKQAQAAAERAANLEAMGAALDDADNAFLSSRSLAGLAAAANGEEPNAALAQHLIDSGLAVRGADGRYRLTADGKGILRAAESGDQNALLDKISEANDKNLARQEKESAAADKEAAAEEEKKQGGGGSGGGSKKPTDAEKQAEKRAERRATAEATAEDVGFDDLDDLTEAADAGGVASQTLQNMGLIDGDGNATDQGRRALTALERGNEREYRAALLDAKRAMERDQARANAQSERARAKAERDAERARRTRKPGAIKMDYTAILEAITRAGDSLAADDAIKAGARHSATDTALLNQICAAACDIKELAVALGADEPEEEEGEEDTARDHVQQAIDLHQAHMDGSEPTDDASQQALMDHLMAAQAALGGGEMGGETHSVGAMKGIEFLGDDMAVLDGYGVKAMPGDDGWVGGYLVRFGGDGDLSQWRDIFTKNTDFGRATKSDVWVHHRMLPGVGKKRLANQADIGIDDEGVFIKHLLDLRSSYERKLYGMVKTDKLGWSSGTAPHLVDRKALGDGRHEIEQWLLGLDASYTPMPAGGLGVEARAGAMKSLFADAGIDLLNAIYDDSPEAGDDVAYSADGQKALADDRARRLALQARIISLQE